MLFSASCVDTNICGACQDRYGTLYPDVVNSECNLYAPLAGSYISSQAIFGTFAKYALDDQPFTHFVSNFTANYTSKNVVYVGGNFSYPFTLTAYRVSTAEMLSPIIMRTSPWLTNE
jgi:hypothetical protein